MTPEQRQVAEQFVQRLVAKREAIGPGFPCDLRYSRVETEALEAILLDIATLEREHATLKEELRQINSGKSPCGHWAAHAMTNDGVKTIQCLECRVATLEREHGELRQWVEQRNPTGFRTLQIVYEADDLLARIPDRSVKPGS